MTTPIRSVQGRGIRYPSHVVKITGVYRQLVFGFCSAYLAGGLPKVLKMSAAEVLALREALKERFPNAQPVVHRTAGNVATGVGALDAMLPGNGLPRGRVTVWRSGGGAAAVLRSACHAVVTRGERAAWIDTHHRITADSWPADAMLLRPGTEAEALACAEELLRCGGFSMVVLAGGDRVFEKEAVRLSRAVHTGGSAFAALVPNSPVAHLRLASRIAPEGYQWKLNPFGEPVSVESVRIEVQAQSMGWNGRCVFVVPVLDFEQRTALDPLLGDRRMKQGERGRKWLRGARPGRGKRPGQTTR